MDNSDGSVEKSFESEAHVSNMPLSLWKDVETLEGVLVKMTEVGLGDSDGVYYRHGRRTCNKGERSVGRRDGGDGTDAIAVGVREGDEEEEEIIDGDSLERLSSIVLRLDS